MLREEGVQIVTHASPAALARGAGGALELAARDGRGLGPFDCVLWAVGRMAAVEDLALAKAGVALDIQGFIATDTYQASSAPGIYAIGDVAGRPPPTPVAVAAARPPSDRGVWALPHARPDSAAHSHAQFPPPPPRRLGA